MNEPTYNDKTRWWCGSCPERGTDGQYLPPPDHCVCVQREREKRDQRTREVEQVVNDLIEAERCFRLWYYETFEIRHLRAADDLQKVRNRMQIDYHMIRLPSPM